MKRALLILITLVLLMGSPAAWAQVPNTLSYQGVLHDGTGGVVPDSTYNITFKLYDVSTGGTELWTEMQATQVQDGIFSVILGKTTPLAIAFDKPYWLGVTVEGSAEFSPRRELTAAAYSLNTKSIEAGAVTESALADNSVTSGKIADDAVGSSEIASGTVVRSLNTLTDDVTLAPGANVTITASGDTLTIGATSVGDNDWTVSGSDMYSAVSGNVGIGTASPSVKLDVSGGINTDTDYQIGGSTVLSTSGTENTLVGVGAGANNTGSSNTFLGRRSGYSNTTGFANTFLGFQAGNSNTEGSYNTFLGQNAGYYNSTGAFNTFLGYTAGYSNTEGSNNTFVGLNAGYSNTTGSFNTFLGIHAGFSNSTGNSNTFVGLRAGNSNTTGNSNTFVGHQAGFSNTTNHFNTFVGKEAGYSNTDGTYNTFVGGNAGYSNTTGFYNTFAGFEAGNSNTSGTRNTFVGKDAGNSNTTGSFNTFLGLNAGSGNTTGAYNTFVGMNAGVHNAGANYNTFVGHGTGSNTTGNFNTFVGQAAGASNTTGTSNTFLGYKAGLSNSTGANNVFIGYEAGYDETGSNTLYIANGPDSADVLIYGNFATPRVGIGTVSPGYTLDVTGECHATGFPTSSDARLKEDVTELTDVLDKLEGIRGVSFEWNALYESLGRSSGHREIGMIAQEVEAVFPELVSSWGEENYRAVDYGRMTGVLIEAVKELRAENQALKERVEALERSAD